MKLGPSLTVAMIISNYFVNNKAISTQEQKVLWSITKNKPMRCCPHSEF